MHLVPAAIGLVTTFSALAFMGSRTNMLPEGRRSIAPASAYFTLGLRTSVAGCDLTERYSLPLLCLELPEGFFAQHVR